METARNEKSQYPVISYIYRIRLSEKLFLLFWRAIFCTYFIAGHCQLRKFRSSAIEKRWKTQNKDPEKC
jgi:hypothetical protein